jgi:hypothetical protein
VVCPVYPLTLQGSLPTIEEPETELGGKIENAEERKQALTERGAVQSMK